MTDAEIRIAIAECLGNKVVERDGCKGWFEWQDKQGRTVTNAYFGKDQALVACPWRFDNDLNAMHEAEREIDKLPFDKKSEWLDWLMVLTMDHPIRMLPDPKFCAQYTAVKATARQRAEAFLRTKGLWKE